MFNAFVKVIPNSNHSVKVTQKVKTVIYLFTVEFIGGNFIHFIFKFSLAIFRCSEVFNPTSCKYAFGKSLQVWPSVP